MAGQDDRVTKNGNASAFPGQSGLGMTKREYMTLILTAAYMEKCIVPLDAIQLGCEAADKLLYKLS